jgi:BMFP domain-containing protein YqiC
MYNTIQLDMDQIHEDVCAQIVAEADVRESDVEQYIRDYISEEFPKGDMLQAAFASRSQVQVMVREELQNYNDIINSLKADIKALNERIEIQGETILILQEMALKQSKRKRLFPWN